MKIREVTFKNINSLKGEHTINFDREPLKNAGLFAITGPTGSGKTTLLDVICLALYNQTPRMKTVSKKTIGESGAILTRNTREARASVTYECKEGVFTSEWSIRTTRNDTLSDYDMSLFDENGTSIVQKKSEVPAKNGALIGLEYDQFVRSILLAQGDFAQFLKSGPKERANLLEKITGTFIYRELGKMAFQKGKEITIRTEKVENAISDWKEKMIPDEELKEHETAYNDLSKRLKNKREAHDKTVQQLNLKKEISTIKQDIGKAQQSIKKLNADLDNFWKSEGLKLQKHKPLKPLSEPLWEWKRINGQIAEDKERVEKLQARLENLTTQQNDLIDRIGSITQKPVTQATAIDELSAFYQQYRDLNTKKADLLENFDRTKSQLVNLEVSSRVKSNVNNPKEVLNELHKIKEDADSSIEKFSQKKREYALEDFSAKQLNELSGNARELVSLEKETKTLIEEISEKEKSVQKIKAELEQAPNKIEKQQAIFDKVDAELNALRSQIELKKVKASLEDLRNELKNGEPCPLCGSDHHPWAHDVPNENVDDEQLKKKQSALDAERESLSKLKAKKENDENELKRENRELSAKKEKLKESLKRQKVLLDGLPEKVKSQNATEIIKVVDEVIDINEKLDKAEREKQSAKAALPIVEDLLKIKQKGVELSEKLKQLYSGDEEELSVLIEKLENNWNETRDEKNKLEHENKQTSKSIEENKSKVEKLEKQLKPQLQDLDYDGIDEALSYLLPHNEEQRLSEIENKLKKGIEKAENDLNHFSELLKKSEDRDVSQTEEELQELKVEQEEAVQNLETDIKKLFATIEQQKDIRKVIAEKQREKEEIEGSGKKWVLLSKQIGDAKGSNFSQFAQQLTLEQLITLANKRLQALTERYLLNSGENEDGDLSVIDRDMGDLQRSIKTLSGGETFLISLALALALSDLASKNITIESMFIDEGFGTLDPQTLDQTLDVLERLQANDNRTIGIISHVDALKERIQTQIKLSPTGQGYSEMEVV
ncbi:AAA family ATPase [Salibacter halophilus]|uniref:AAA family ATPase n=1 Tax=Salibacter halophilus TaxID=1803916 RepID=A0A6N6M8P6_9FLAO|nr:SbcC/MukB-like Walker B domain-containing protein [Salibacter halophilus]KAB1064388.1 AAA family ATPase [Salibacter halophilus]